MADDSLESQLRKLINSNEGGWHSPWKDGITLPQNPITDRAYSGRNALKLWITQKENNYPFPLWATFGQWRKKGATVIAGQKGTKIIVPRRSAQSDMFDRSSESTNGFGQITVFNEAQVNNYNPMHPDLFSGLSTNNDFETYVLNAAPKIQYHFSSSAHYTRRDDTIFLPKAFDFQETLHDSAKQAFFDTLGHELIHWTGHESRLGRLKKSPSRDEYAFEELIAELGAAMLKRRFYPIASSFKNNAAYLASWLSGQSDADIKFSAAFGQAVTAINFLDELQPKYNDASNTVSDDINDADCQPDAMIWPQFEPDEYDLKIIKIETVMKKKYGSRYVTANVQCPYCGSHYSVTFEVDESSLCCIKCGKGAKLELIYE